MTPEEIVNARNLIATVGEPKGSYATAVMDLFRKALDGHERANLQIEAWRPVIEAAKATRREEKWPYLNMCQLTHALDELKARRKAREA
jgi:hypothetical protein